MRCGCKRRRRDFRRQIIARLGPLFGAEHVRAPGPKDGPFAPDVLAPHVAVTCVRGEKVDVRAALREATGRTRFPDEWTVAACKDDGQAPIIAMSLDQFLELLHEWHTYRRRSPA